MKITCGRYELELNKNDIIFDNGACYQIITREVGTMWHKHIPVLAKAKAKKLIKDGVFVLINEEMKYVTSDGREMWHRYYKIA